MKKNYLKKAEESASSLLNQLGFDDVTISTTKDDDGVIHLNIDTSPDNSGLLIGFHGENIQALQLILGYMINKGSNEWNPISVNIGDYREKRKESLESMASNAAQRVKLTQQSVTLPYLSSNERRIVHLMLSQDNEIETFSEGTGRDRRLIIDLKKNKDT